MITSLIKIKVPELQIQNNIKEENNEADPLSDFFPFKNAPNHDLVSENCRFSHASARSCFPITHTHTPLSLSLCICLVSVQRAAEKSSAFIQLNTDILLRASQILHASIAKITAQLLSLSYVYLILSDNGSIIWIFVQIKILEGRAG